MNLTTRELLYLEDDAKLFDSIEKNCSRGAQATNDTELESLLQGLAEDHRNWRQTITSIVTSNGSLQ